MFDLEKLLARTEQVLVRLKTLLPAPPKPVDWRAGPVRKKR